MATNSKRSEWKKTLNKLEGDYKSNWKMEIEHGENFEENMEKEKEQSMDLLKKVWRGSVKNIPDSSTSKTSMTRQKPNALSSDQSRMKTSNKTCTPKWNMLNSAESDSSESDECLIDTDEGKIRNNFFASYVNGPPRGGVVIGIITTGQVKVGISHNPGLPQQGSERHNEIHSNIPPTKPARMQITPQNSSNRSPQNFSNFSNRNNLHSHIGDATVSNRKQLRNYGYDNIHQGNMGYIDNVSDDPEFGYSGEFDSDEWNNLCPDRDEFSGTRKEKYDNHLPSSLSGEQSVSGLCHHHHHLCHHHHHHCHQHHFNHKEGCPAGTAAQSHGHYHGNLSHVHHPYARKQQQMMQLGELMETLAESAGFEIHDVSPDGNCMFRSVIDQLRMQGELHLTAVTLRKDSVRYLRENPCLEDGSHLQEFLPLENWDDYLARMKQDGEWGDQMMLRGIAEVIGRRICIISAIGDTHNQITIAPSKPEFDQSEDIFLGHMDDLHYISLRSKHWRDTWFINARKKSDVAKRPGPSDQARIKTAENDKTEPEFPSTEDLIDRKSGFPFYHLSFIMRNVLSESYLYTFSYVWEETAKKAFSSDNTSFQPTIAGSVVENFDVAVVNTSPMKQSYFLGKTGSDIPSKIRRPDFYGVDYSHWRVVFDGRKATKKDAYIALQNDLHPGYLRLQPMIVMENHEEITWLDGHTPCTNTNTYRDFDVEKKKEKTLTRGFFVESWPDDALEWITRDRPSKWPDQTLIQDSINDGCLVVPFSHPHSKLPECEWRFSFAISEKRLAHSVLESQRYCFHLFKVLVDFFTKNIKRLSTYYLKTVFFHTCEIVETQLWKEFPVHCVLFLVEKFLKYLRDGNLPHYFITANNIIDHFSEDDVEKLITQMEAIREFPALSIILLAESHGLPSVPLADPVLDDIKHFREHLNIHRTVMEAVVPTLLSLAQNNIKYMMYEPATRVVKQAHDELKCSGSLNPGEEHLSQFVQQFICNLVMQQKFWFCFFFDCYYKTSTTNQLTSIETEYKTVKQISGVDLHEGQFDDVQVPVSVLQQSRFGTPEMGHELFFMQQLCMMLYSAELYEENCYYLRCYIKLLKDKLQSLSKEQNNQSGVDGDRLSNENTVSGEQQAAYNQSNAVRTNRVKEETADDKYKKHVVSSACNGVLINALICLYHCYENTHQVELFQEYVDDLEEACDKEPSPRNYQNLANIWYHLGNQHRYQEAMTKKQALM